MKLPSGHGVPHHKKRGTALVDSRDLPELQTLLGLRTPTIGLGEHGFLSFAESIVNQSVNTWSAGFLAKLYASPDPPGVAAELLVASLNTNAHVYAVSPALSCVEKHVTQELAALFGLRGPQAGGVSMPGGAAANITSMLVARNVMFPETKAAGVGALPKPLAAFVSVDAHYSISSAAATLGLGSSGVHTVPVDEHGAMSISALESAIESVLKVGQKPFYVCATAGTTVRGSYDPLSPIADVCTRHRLWSSRSATSTSLPAATTRRASPSTRTRCSACP